MKKRSITIWDIGDKILSVEEFVDLVYRDPPAPSSKYRNTFRCTYNGCYREKYEDIAFDPPKNLKTSNKTSGEAKKQEYSKVRVGKIFDRQKGIVVSFRQYVKSLKDDYPTDVLIKNLNQNDWLKPNIISVNPPPMDLQKDKQLIVASHSNISNRKVKRCYINELDIRKPNDEDVNVSSDAPVKSQKTPTDEYVFYRNGDFWQIIFNQSSLGSIRHLDGLTYLHALISHPNQEFLAFQLYQLEHQPSPDVLNAFDHKERINNVLGKANRIADKKGIESVEKKIEEINEELKYPIEFEKKNELELEKEKCEKYLAGCNFTFESKDQKKARDNVNKCIKRALDVIGKQPQGIKMKTHLDENIKKNRGTNTTTFVYLGKFSWKTM